MHSSAERTPSPPRFSLNRKLCRKAILTIPFGGDRNGYRDLHLEPDWLLLYRIEGSDLYLARTGAHADLFGK